jgi:acetoin utilization protein AcuB
MHPITAEKGGRADERAGHAQEDAVTARDLMTANPVTAAPEATVAEVWDLMREADIRHIPVVEGGALIGMVSDRDLGHLNVGRLLTVEGAEAVRRELATPVVEIMNADVIFVEAETDLSDVVDLLLENKIGALPVIRPDTREIEGIVSYIDVLRALQELLAEE